MATSTYAVKKVTDLTPAKDNPRKNLGDLTELVASIKAHGIVEPLLVTPDGVIICGHRRLEGARQAALAEVPVIVKDVDEKVRIETMLVENLHREDLSPLEEAQTYRRMLDELGYTQRTIAERVARSQSHISKRLALLGLPEATRKTLDAGDLSVNDALELAKLPTPELVKATVSKAKLHGAPIAREVQVVLADQERIDRIKASEAEVKKAGWTLMDGSKAYTSEVQHINEKDVPAHEKAGCHSVYISGMGRIEHVCTARKTHETKPSGRSKVDQEKKAAAAHDRDLHRARKDRLVFEQSIVTKRVPAADRLGFLSYVIVNGMGAEAAKHAARILGIEFKDGMGSEAKTLILAAYANAGDVEAQARLATACAMGMLEASFTSSWGGTSAYAKPLLEFLSGLGYVPTEAEKLEAAGKAPRRPY